MKFCENIMKKIKILEYGVIDKMSIAHTFKAVNLNIFSTSNKDIINMFAKKFINQTVSPDVSNDLTRLSLPMGAKPPD